jgi:hypothetical protein
VPASQYEVSDGSQHSASAGIQADTQKSQHMQDSKQRKGREGEDLPTPHSVSSEEHSTPTGTSVLQLRPSTQQVFWVVQVSPASQ